MTTTGTPPIETRHYLDTLDHAFAQLVELAETGPDKPIPYTLSNNEDGCAGCEVCELATELAAERTAHQTTLDLLRAIADALNVPLPATTDRDGRLHHWLLTGRATSIHVAITAVLEGANTEARAAVLRLRTAETPITYTTWAPNREREGGAR